MCQILALTVVCVLALTVVHSLGEAHNLGGLGEAEAGFEGSALVLERGLFALLLVAHFDLFFGFL